MAGAYIVGEKGPEVFVPNQDGYVIPNHKLPMSLRKAAKKKRLPGRASGGEVEAERIYRPYQQEAEAAVKAGPSAVAKYHERTAAGPSAYQEYPSEVSVPTRQASLRDAASQPYTIRNMTNRNVSVPSENSDATLLVPGHSSMETKIWNRQPQAYDSGLRVGLESPRPVVQTQPGQHIVPRGPHGSGDYDASQIPAYGQGNRNPRPLREYGTDYGDTGLRGHPQEAQILDYEAKNGYRTGVQRRQNRSAVGYDPIPDALAQDGPHSPNRFFRDQNGVIWDRGYLNVDPTRQIAGEYPESPADESTEPGVYPQVVSGLQGAYPIKRQTPGEMELERRRRFRENALRESGSGMIPRAAGGPVRAGGPGLRWAATGRENLPGRYRGGRVETNQSAIEAASRERVAEINAAAQIEAASRASGDIVGSGINQHYTKGTPVSKVVAEREAGVKAGEASLGSPESYGGGLRAPIPQLRNDQLSTGPVGYDPTKQNFSNPVQILRRGVAYSGPDSGEEYRTLRQANQSFIRARQGEALPGTIPGYDPPEGPKLRLAADLNDKNPLQKAQAEAFAGGQLNKLLEDRLLKDYGVSAKGEDGQETLALPPEIKRLALGYRPKNADDVESFMQKIAPEGAKIKTLNQWNDPKTGMAMRRQLLATTTDPAEQKRIKEEQVTPETLAWFEGRRAGASSAQPSSVTDIGNLPEIERIRLRQKRILAEAAEAQKQRQKEEETFQRRGGLRAVLGAHAGPVTQDELDQMDYQREQDERRRDLKYLRTGVK